MDVPYETVLERYADLVYRIAVSQTKSLHDAEDIFQDVFVQLTGHLHELESEAHLKHWLIRVTMNRCKNYHLSFWKRRVALDAEAGMNRSVPAMQEDPLVSAVREKLAALPPKLKAVVYLYYYEEYSTEEIAAMLKLPRGTVKSRLYHARRLLKQELKEVI